MSVIAVEVGRNHGAGRYLGNVGGLVGLVFGRIGVLVTGLVLVRIRGHEALDGDEDGLQNLRG